MIESTIVSSLPALIARLQEMPRNAPDAMEQAHEEAVKKDLRHAEHIAPYKTGALAESLHPVAQPTRTTASGTTLRTSIEPGPEIFYSIYLVKKGGRLDWVSRTAEERADVAQRAADAEAAAITALIEKGS